MSDTVQNARCQTQEEELKEELKKSEDHLKEIFYSPQEKACLYVHLYYVPREIDTHLHIQKFIELKIIDGEVLIAKQISMADDYADHVGFHQEVNQYRQPN